MKVTSAFIKNNRFMAMENTSHEGTDNLFLTHRGATITDTSKIKQVFKDQFTDSTEEHTESVLILENQTRLGDGLDRMPYGIIDKRITGIGATTLEVLNSKRNSIIVVPTKSLAYNKHKTANQMKGDGYSMYIGSTIHEITKGIEKNDVQHYLDNKVGANDFAKFLVVADSLGKLLYYLNECGVKWEDDYFLLIDEIDTMQEDSGYRPKLEDVMDWYFKFPQKHRAVVSATLNPFSNPLMLSEHKTTIEWENNPKREIKLYYTDYVDDVAKNTIRMLLYNTTDKILIAYNSIDGIANIITQLPSEFKNEIGILCSERSNDKVKLYLEDTDNVITEDGFLNKRIVFMTCAYFAGIDIMDKCHLISVSSHLQPFTYLSINRLTQIAGRCRNGNLSETIIYDIKSQYDTEKKVSLSEYKDNLINKATLYSEALNKMQAVIAENTELSPLLEFLEYYMTFLSKAKIDKDSYALKTVRLNSTTKEFVPAYFNIDALIQRLHLKKTLYADRQNLYTALSENNDVKYEEIILLSEEHNTENIKQIKENNALLMEVKLAKLKNELLGWFNNGKSKAEFNAINNQTDKKVQKICMTFSLLCDSFPVEWLIDMLLSKYGHGRTLRNTINSLFFYTLPNNHKFKALVLQRFECSHILNNLPYKEYRKSVRRWESKDKADVFMSIFKDLHRSNKVYSSSILSEMFSGFFNTRKIGGKEIIIGLNPNNYPQLTSYLPANIEEIEYLILSPLE